LNKRNIYNNNSSLDVKVNSTLASETKSRDPFSTNLNDKIKTISRNDKLFQNNPHGNTLNILNNPYFDDKRANTQMDESRNDSLLIIDKYESKENAKKRREAMKDIPFDVLYPFKPVKLLMSPDKNTLTVWKESKHPSVFIDKYVF
jgi:hypothetical protein